MTTNCDGCMADATHHLCATCLDDAGRDALRAEITRLRGIAEDALSSLDASSGLLTLIEAPGLKSAAHGVRHSAGQIRKALAIPSP